MYDLLLIPHSDVSRKELKEIIKVKTFAWPYSYNKQIEWIRNHLKESDIHVLLSHNNVFVAYLNLISIDLKINGIMYSSLGVGNVCAKEKGKGWGKELMMQSNTVLVKENKIGLLFCKEVLVSFYALCKWGVIDNRKLIVGFNNKDTVTMYFNYIEPIKRIEFIGQPF